MWKKILPGKLLSVILMDYSRTFLTDLSWNSWLSRTTLQIMVNNVFIFFLLNNISPYQYCPTITAHQKAILDLFDILKPSNKTKPQGQKNTNLTPSSPVFLVKNTKTTKGKELFFYNAFLNKAYNFFLEEFQPWKFTIRLIHLKTQCPVSAS